MTNTVNLESGVFKNSDGLRVKYGLAEARKGVAGTVALKDDERVLYVDIDSTRLPVFNASSAIGNLYGSEPESSIPTGAIISAASLEVTTAFTGGGTLTLGLVDSLGADQSKNAGLASAITPGAAGSVTALAGASIGAAATTLPLYLWVNVGTATFTAGAARLKVTYNLPRSV